MRLGFKLLLGAVVACALAAGLLPPLFREASLRTSANTAAQAGAQALLSPNASNLSVNKVVSESLRTHHGVTVSSIRVDHGIVTVVVRENVHTFMSGIPGLKHYFHLAVTESASELGVSQ